MYRETGRKIFHTIVIVTIIFVILCVAGILILRYQVEGETNMPFSISKISIIQSVEGNELTEGEEKWKFNVNQNNDIYVYIEKNSSYGKTEVIDSVEINNITISKTNQTGETKLYKPVQDESVMFKNLAENEITDIKYQGDLESNIKEQKISNQGGIVAFRYAINNISQYRTNDGEEIDYSKLLQLSNVQKEDIQTKLTFNLTINLRNNRKYETTIEIDIPTDEIIEKGTVGIEKTDLQNIVFKRIEN